MKSASKFTGFLDNSGEVVLNTHITDEGRQGLAKEDAGHQGREEEIDTGKPVEPTESMPEPDMSEHFREIDEMKEAKEANTSDLPKPPTMLSSEGLSEEDALQARSQNRERVIEYYNDFSRDYGDVEKQLHSAKYKEDVSLDRMPYDLKESADEDDWNEPEDRLNEADRDDDKEDDEEDND